MPKFEDLPEEIQDVIIHKQMEMESTMRSRDDFLYGLDLDSTIILADLLRTIAQNGKQAANYYEGMLRGIIRERWNVCATHGVNHEDDALSALQGSTEPRDKAVSPGTTVSDVVGGFFEAVKNGGLTDNETKAKEAGISLSDDSVMDFDPQGALILYGDRMFEYRVVNKSGIKVTAGNLSEMIEYPVVCQDCGYQYPNLADRMLKTPDDCPGCHLKSAHG